MPYSQVQDKCVPMQIVVHGLPWSTEWQELKDLAKEHGDVIKADVMRRPDGKSRGFGTVVFKTPEDAQSAIEVSIVLPAPSQAMLLHGGSSVEALKLHVGYVIVTWHSPAPALHTSSPVSYLSIMLDGRQLRTTQGLNGLDFEGRKLSAKVDQYN